VRRTCLAAIALLAVACATYTSKMEHSRDLYYEGRYAEALSGLDRLIADSSGRDRSLLLLERGKVNLALDRYDSAIVDLQAAETKFLDIEATMSVAEIFKNILVNPTMSEYQPEAYEKIMISSYLLLAYWLEGDREGAFVERNRLVGRLKQYTDDLSEEDRASLDVPFARYLAALMYEVEGSEDDARIEYDAIGSLSPQALPQVLEPDLPELVVFAETGRAPVRVSTEIRGYLQKNGGALVGFFYLPGSTEPRMFALAGLADLKLDRPGVLFTFAFPQCIEQPRYVRECRLVIDGVEAGEMTTLDDLENTAYVAYKKDLPMTLLKAAFRTYVKIAAQTKVEEKNKKTKIAFDVIGKALAAVDRADTRSWQTLPAEVRVFRMECNPGEHEVFVRYVGEHGELLGVSQTLRFSQESTPKQILYFPSGP
jgi:tetratricopeptide (TPR) repeat protein